MTISEQEIMLDVAADAAANNLRCFREKHWGYFCSVDRYDIRGFLSPRKRDEKLDRESARLFSIVVKANKAALDAEYSQRVKHGCF